MLLNLIRSLPIRSASGLAVHVAASLGRSIRDFAGDDWRRGAEVGKI